MTGDGRATPQEMRRTAAGPVRPGTGRVYSTSTFENSVAMVRPGKLFWKVFLVNVVLMTAVLTICTTLIVMQVERFHMDQTTRYLRSQALLLRQASQDRFDRSHSGELNGFSKSIGRDSGNELRVTLILPDGLVLADSQADPVEMEPHDRRPEVATAFRDGWGEDTRLSRTVRERLKYVAVRVGPADAPLGVARVAMPVHSISERAAAMQKLVITISLIGLIAVVVFALGLAQLWSNPIRLITRTARNLSEGNLSARANVTGDDEVSALGRALNDMREHLASQLSTIDRQRRTLESLLTQLQEGVIVVGRDGRVVLVNRAAVRMLGLADHPEEVDINRYSGRLLEECIPQKPLQDMLLPRLSRKGAEDEPSPDSTRTHGFNERRLQIDSPEGRISLLARTSDVALPGPAGPADVQSQSTTGRLLVLTDITALHRALQMKTDFAANASHELRTPLSAIRAATETLLNLDLQADAGSARNFVEMIGKHGKRMEEMVDDLLDLSRVESSPDRFKPQRIKVHDMFAELEARHRPAVQAKDLHWRVEVGDRITTIQANPYLLRLTLDNLIENAIKFTDPGGHLNLACHHAPGPDASSGMLAISVADDGCGIPEPEQSRVFERFYQVEKARSGEGRGTGLGLSIVRHAVSAMRGTLELRSKPGTGTIITITLPHED